MGVEGVFISHGGCHKIFSWWSSPFYKLVIVALVVTIFVGDGQADLFNNKKHSKPHIYKSVESKNLSQRIKQLVCELGYSKEAAEDFITLVNSWQNKKENAFFALCSQKLHYVRENYMQGRNEVKDVAKVEQRIVEDIAWLIKNRFNRSDEDFELVDVIRKKQANCLGYLQSFYILGSSIDLSVIPINVVELQAPGPLPTGAAHVSCIVNLSNGKTIMLNLAPGGFVSEPFIMEKKFTRIGNYWELKDKNNPLGIYRKVQLLDKDGLIAYIYSNRGNVYAATGQFNQSICDYTEAIKLNPNFAEAYNNRGIAYRNMGQLKKAIADYTKAIELNPNYAEAYNNRGVAYDKLGQLHQGICDYNKSIELNPKFAAAYNNRANSYIRLGQFNQAIPDYNRAINNNSHLAKAYGNRAIAFALVGKHKGAKKDLLRAIELNPNLKSQIRQISDRFKLGLKLD